MPTYGYLCLDCRKRYRKFLTFAEYDTAVVECPHCSSTNNKRLLSRVRTLRSEESRLESMADPSKLAGLEDDPRALGKMMREMSKEMGEDMGPEFDEVIERLEKGQSPEDIENEMPDLADSMGDGMGGGMDMGGMDMGGLDF
jgi:putative FmdB family regulatory protein